MSLDHDELNRRRQEREKRRKRRQRMMYIKLVLAAIVLIACGIGIFFLIKHNKPPSAPTMATLPMETVPGKPERSSVAP